MYCPKCGTANEASANFCRSCGHTLASAAMPPGPSPVAHASLPEYEPPGWGLPVLGWIFYVLGLLGLVANDHSAIGLGFIAAVVLVGIDAASIGVNALKHSSLDRLSGIDRSSTALWVLGCLLLWIVVVPLYWIKRNKLAHAAWKTMVTKAFNQDGNLNSLAIVPVP